MLKSVYCLDSDKFSALFPDIPPYRFSQIDDWRKTGVESFEDYKNLGSKTKEELQKKCNVFSSFVQEEHKSEDSVKLLIKLSDNLAVECVYMSDERGYKTVCLSSQCGCACGCKFCATGSIGLKRNLEYYEIIEQYYHLKRIFKKIDKIVFMGMGEPLLNLENVARSIEYIKKNENISARRITISTCGIAEKIKELADKKLGVKLTLSLVCANQKLREKIMPVARNNTLDDLKKSLLYFQKKDARRITLAYCMLKGVNISKENARELKGFSSSLISHINLIPWNRIEQLDFIPPSAKEISEFENMLSDEHLVYSTRYSKGDKISAACGQLVAKADKD